MIVTPKKTNPCLPEEPHAWSQLQVGQLYPVIGIEDDMFRIQISDTDWKPSLYHALLFDVCDSSVEPEWVIERIPDQDNKLDLYIGYPEFKAPGFWEDVHDDDPESLRILVPIFDRLGLTYHS